MEPDAAVGNAIDVLAEHLLVSEAHAVDSHTALEVSGLSDDRVVEALGLYLVGLLAGVVRTNLRLSVTLLDRTPDGKAQLAADVEKRLVPAGTASPEALDAFKINVRDPWIAEGIGHAILAVRNRVDSACLSGQVVAVAVPHSKPSQQGLDLVAVYDDAGMPAVALGEAKATRENGSERLTESIGFFREIEAGDRDVDIRMQMVLLREALDVSLQRGLSGSFWQQRASFLPLIVYGDEVDLGASRPALRALVRPATQKRVIHCRPPEYREFFDKVADAMRAAVGTVNP